MLYVSNDNVIELTSLKNVKDDSYINDATVIVTLKNAAGVALTGQSWPTTLSYVTDSNGTYRATLSDSLVITTGTAYYAEVTADGGEGLLGFWKVKLFATTRTV